MERRGFVQGLVAGLVGLIGAGRLTAQDPVPQTYGVTGAPIDLAALKAMIGYPVEEVEGAKALARWEELRAAGQGYPVIVGDADALSIFGEPIGFEERDAPAAIIARAAKLEWPQAIADERRREREAYAAEYASGAIEEDFEAEEGDWPAEIAPDPDLTTNIEILTGKPYAKCDIVILPARHGWEVPAYANWGGWNANPAPDLHVAALKSWHDRYGAELVGMSGDVLNLRVARKPASREEALALAREQYAYCADIVDQGVGTIAALAASLMKSRWWFFWWD